MFVKNPIHGVKKVLERCVRVIILKFQNMGPIYFKIVQNKLFTIEFRLITFKDIGFFCWEHLKKCGVQEEIVVSDLIWLMLGCLILFPERYNWKKYYQ